MEWYFEVLKKYADFNGRARRTEYWTFALVNLIIGSILGTLSAIPLLGLIFKMLSGIFSLLILIPSLAVSVRRLHDIDKTGWFLLLCLIPIAGPIILLVFFCTDSNPGPNAYGESPKAYR